MKDKEIISESNESAQVTVRDYYMARVVASLSPFLSSTYSDDTEHLVFDANDIVNQALKTRG